MSLTKDQLIKALGDLKDSFQEQLKQHATPSLPATKIEEIIYQNRHNEDYQIIQKQQQESQYHTSYKDMILNNLDPNINNNQDYGHVKVMDQSLNQRRTTIQAQLKEIDKLIKENEEQQKQNINSTNNNNIDSSSTIDNTTINSPINKFNEGDPK